jgi:hypothetical protein
MVLADWAGHGALLPGRADRDADLTYQVMRAGVPSRRTKVVVFRSSCAVVAGRGPDRRREPEQKRERFAPLHRLGRPRAPGTPPRRGREAIRIG